jgi:hypothetical protein
LAYEMGHGLSTAIELKQAWGPVQLKAVVCYSAIRKGARLKGRGVRWGPQGAKHAIGDGLVAEWAERFPHWPAMISEPRVR